MDQSQPTDEILHQQSSQEVERAEPREWVEPTFESMTLNDAMTSTFHPPYANDGIYNYS